MSTKPMVKKGGATGSTGHVFLMKLAGSSGCDCSSRDAALGGHYPVEQEELEEIKMKGSTNFLFKIRFKLLEHIFPIFLLFPDFGHFLHLFSTCHFLRPACQKTTLRKWAPSQHCPGHRPRKDGQNGSVEDFEQASHGQLQIFNFKAMLYILF